MKKARFTDEQIVRTLLEADRDPIAAVAKRHGVGESSIYVWRKRFGDMSTVDVKRLCNLEQANSRLKKSLAEHDLEIEVMKEINQRKNVVSVRARLAQACYAIERGVSQRRACALLQVARSGLTFTCKMPIKDAPIVQAMRHYSSKYPRFEARRVRIFLRRDGVVLGQTVQLGSGQSTGFRCQQRRPRSTIGLNIRKSAHLAKRMKCGVMTLSLMPVRTDKN